MNDKLYIASALLVATVIGIAGGSSLNPFKTQAADIQTAQLQQTPAQPTQQTDPSKGGHVGANGVREELLTGEIAERARAAALAAVPGGTIQRLETDAEGSPYEAHMLRSDGTAVTVKFDSNFNVTATEEGLGKKVR